MNEDQISLALRTSLGRNLRDLRLRAGVTQEALALQVGLSATYVSQVEAGQRSVTLTTLQKLADGLGVAPWQLLYDPNEIGYRQ